MQEYAAALPVSTLSPEVTGVKLQPARMPLALLLLMVTSYNS